MGRTFRRDSDDWPKRDRRHKRRNNNKANKKFNASPYNNTEDYRDINYLSDYSDFERFDRKKKG